VVAAVAPDGPARRTGVERLDVLLALGETYVSSLADLGLRLERVEAGQELPIRVLRVDRRRRVVLNGVIRVD
jgi:S1-C subfamily serine protease